MTVTIELTDAQAADITARAAAQGETVEGWIQKLTDCYVPPNTIAHLQRTDPEEWGRRFHEWAESHDRTTPPLSDYAVSRESIYEDRF